MSDYIDLIPVIVEREQAILPDGFDHERLRRFVEKFEVRESGCWEWKKPQATGYGHFWTGTRTVKAHRWSYEMFVGPLPDGLVLDHLCRNRACVNPEHLEPVTQSVNLLRGETVNAAASARTHCINGHEFSPVNTRISPSGRRVCRSCGRARSLAHWRANHA